MITDLTYFPTVVVKTGEVFFSREMYHEYMVLVVMDDLGLESDSPGDIYCEDMIWCCTTSCMSDGSLNIEWAGLDSYQELPPWIERNLVKYGKAVEKRLKPACVLFRKKERSLKPIDKQHKNKEINRVQWVKEQEKVIWVFFKALRKLDGYLWKEKVDEEYFTG